MIAERCCGGAAAARWARSSVAAYPGDQRRHRNAVSGAMIQAGVGYYGYREMAVRLTSVARLLLTAGNR
ncbi:hypothetical protein IRT45_28810 [Nocardia sp. BSTN01]|uniref:hypothetical protein n=1 Tax=Nocardia sp. BSTN01 TaxID=2783665 RepID=UPI00188F6315|nr:hypothetical protein [Nocardia sp. BSTN01]MBF5001142.1 hypothetical protein [Nocardia sp. BSTN01]